MGAGLEISNGRIPEMNREPNALDAAASVAMTIAEYVAYAIIMGAPIAAWIMTPAGMQ